MGTWSRRQQLSEDTIYRSPAKKVLSCCSVVVYDNHRAHDRDRQMDREAAERECRVGRVKILLNYP